MASHQQPSKEVHVVVTRSARLVVFGIVDGDVVVGGSCCALSADDVVQMELDSCPGVRTTSIDTATGAVDVELDERAPSLAKLAAWLTSSGFPAIPA